MPPRLRPLQPQDADAVGEMAYRTGFFGASAARYFPARRLFQLLWAGPYFGPQGVRAQTVGFVAEDDQGTPLGYIIGMTDEKAYRRALLQTLALGIWSRLAPPRALGPSLHYLVRAGLFGVPHADVTRYPAHLHLNLLAQARGLGLGRALLAAYLDELAARNVAGVQLSTTAENRAALGLYQSFGFEVTVARVTPLWTPWLGHAAEQVVMVRPVKRAAAEH